MRKETKREIERVWRGQIVAGIGLCSGLVDEISISAHRPLQEWSLLQLQEQLHEQEQTLLQLQEQLQEQLHEQEQTLLQLQERPQEQTLLQLQERPQEQEQLQVLLQELLQVGDRLVLSLFTLAVRISLLFLLKLRNAISASLIGQLICFIPEECVAELGALHSRLIKRRIPTWKVRLMMLWCVLSLLWAFYIQINIENLGLPKIGGGGSIDE